MDLKTGEVKAIFHQEKSPPSWGRFFRRGQGVYIVTNAECFKMDPADIDAKRNGWR